jgi:hypothetical protein
MLIKFTVRKNLSFEKRIYYWYRNMSIRTLQVWEEIVGRLEKAEETANGTIACFAGLQYFLPDFPKDLHADLLKLVGAHIGILRLTDGYRIRVLTTYASPAHTGRAVQKNVLRGSLHGKVLVDISIRHRGWGDRT